jgi:hypothetical protein
VPGQVELDRAIGGLGRAEEGARVGEQRPAGRPDERLEPDRLAGRHREDRLVDRAQRPRGEDRADRVGQLRDRPVVGCEAVAIRVERDDRGPAVALAPVQRRIGVAVEVLARDARVRVRGHADRHGERLDRSAGVAAADRRGEDPPADLAAGVDVGYRQEDRELVAADPERPVAAPQHGRRHPADGLKEPVAAGVALRVVHDLQVVDVDQEQSKRQLHPLRHLELTGQLVLERTVVAEPRQAVDERVVAGPAVELLQLVALTLEGVDLARDRHPQEPEQDRQSERGQQQGHRRESGVAQVLRRVRLDRGDSHQDAEGQQQRPDQAPPDALDAIGPRAGRALHSGLRHLPRSCAAR